MKAITILTLLLVVTGVSCTKDDTDNQECLETGIQGDWLWLKTEGGVSGALITPENAGYTLRLEIDDLLWREFVNDSLSEETPYTFHKDTSPVFNTGWVEFDNGSGVSATIYGCNLSLQCGFNDCFVSTYERIN